MDLLRGGAVLLVVLLHSTNFMPGEKFRGLLWFNSAVASYRLPLLFFVSGMLLNKSLAKPAPVYLAGKFRAIAWPWLVWGVICTAITGWDQATSIDWWYGGTITWFLGTLMVIYLLALPLRRIPFWLISGGALTLSLLIGVPEPGFADRLGGLLWFMFFFFAGATVSSNIERVLTLPIPLIAVCGAITAGWSAYSIKAGVLQTRYFTVAVAALVGIVTVVWLASRLPRYRWVRAIEYVGRRSIVTYLVHWPVLLLLDKVEWLPEGNAGVAIYLLSSLTVSLLMVRYWEAFRFLFVFPKGIAQKVPVRVHRG